MIRKLLLPAIAIALLGGCMTGGYSYYPDRGDYYYGQPTIDYRYYGSPYGYDRYGYPLYSRYRYGFGGYYGYPYYYDPYGGYPYYPYRPRPPVVVVPPPDGNTPPPPDDGNRDRRPPWRNLDNLGRRAAGELSPPRSEPLPAMPVPTPPRATVQPRQERGSRMQQAIRRANEERRPREDE